MKLRTYYADIVIALHRRIQTILELIALHMLHRHYDRSKHNLTTHRIALHRNKINHFNSPPLMNHTSNVVSIVVCANTELSYKNKKK